METKRMIVEYYTVWEYSQHHLIGDVNDCLADGWELYGNPYTSINDDGDTVYNQAMVRRAK